MEERAAGTVLCSFRIASAYPGRGSPSTHQTTTTAFSPVRSRTARVTPVTCACLHEQERRAGAPLGASDDGAASRRCRDDVQSRARLRTGFLTAFSEFSAGTRIENAPQEGMAASQQASGLPSIGCRVQCISLVVCKPSGAPLRAIFAPVHRCPPREKAFRHQNARSGHLRTARSLRANSWTCAARAHRCARACTTYHRSVVTMR